jgi:hypothetical protein
MIASMWDVPHVTEKRYVGKPEGKRPLRGSWYRGGIIRAKI